MAGVRDGSTGEIVNGYSVCDVIACDPGSRRMIPLHQRLKNLVALVLAAAYFSACG